MTKATKTQTRYTKTLNADHTSREGHEKKVALLGFADSYKQAPFDDPTVSIWGLNELWKYLPRWDAWFEMHDADTLGVTKRDLTEGEVKRHLDWLSQDYGERPIYMQPFACGKGHDRYFPNAIPYPIDRMAKQFGRYFTSSIGYMIALAIDQGYTWIGLYGIDLVSDNDEYVNQRPNAEYLVGIARGLGRTVYIAEGSAMCKAANLYGYEPNLKETSGLYQNVKSHQGNLKKKHEETLAMLNTLDGAIQECDNFLKLIDFKTRGSQIETY